MVNKHEIISFQEFYEKLKNVLRKNREFASLKTTGRFNNNNNHSDEIIQLYRPSDILSLQYATFVFCDVDIVFHYYNYPLQITDLSFHSDPLKQNLLMKCIQAIYMLTHKMFLCSLLWYIFMTYQLSNFYFWLRDCCYIM